MRPWFGGAEGEEELEGWERREEVLRKVDDTGVECPLVCFLFFVTRSEEPLPFLLGIRVGVSPVLCLFWLLWPSMASFPLASSLVRDVVLLGRLTPDGEGESEGYGASFFAGGVPSVDLCAVFLFLAFFFV